MGIPMGIDFGNFWSVLMFWGIFTQFFGPGPGSSPGPAQGWGLRGPWARARLDPGPGPLPLANPSLDSPSLANPSLAIPGCVFIFGYTDFHPFSMTKRRVHSEFTQKATPPDHDDNDDDRPGYM